MSASLLNFEEVCNELHERNERLNKIMKNIDTEIDAILTVLNDMEEMCEEYYDDCSGYLKKAQKVVDDNAVTAMSILHDGFYKDAYTHLEELKKYKINARILLNEVAFQKELHLYSQYWGIERERYIVSCILQHLLDFDWFIKHTGCDNLDNLKRRRLRREAPELVEGVSLVFGDELSAKTFLVDVAEFINFYNNSDISTIKLTSEKSMQYFLKLRQYLTSRDGVIYMEDNTNH